MNMHKWAVQAALLAFAVNLASGAEDPAVVAARQIFNEHHDAVLWVSAVCKVSFSTEGGKDQPQNFPEQERKIEALATVISTNGMLVTSLSAIDPAREVSGREIMTGSGRVRIEASSVMKEMEVIMPDGTEVPADVVMKDADLDLAFIRLKTDSKEFKGQSLSAIDLKQAAKAAIAEEVLGRQPTVLCGQVSVLLKKPREFVRVTSANLGTPTFDLDGKLIGIGVSRRMANKSSVLVLIPAADIGEIAEQARNAGAQDGRPAADAK
jgi:S1-C subfamily serine protease